MPWKKPKEGPRIVPLVNKVDVVAYVSQRDYDRVMVHKWAAYNDGKGNGDRSYRAHLYDEAKVPRGGIFLHRFILCLEDARHVVRFKNGDKLWCTRENMVLSIRESPANGNSRKYRVGFDMVNVPCGAIMPSKDNDRCNGLGIKGRPHCPHYDDCLGLCVASSWPGFRRVPLTGENI